VSSSGHGYLAIKQNFINNNRECAYANGTVVSAEGLDILRLGAIAPGG
jgi:hypothetical protein